MKASLICFILFLFSQSLYAGQSLMRLFYTPAERAQLDQNRLSVKNKNKPNVTSQSKTRSVEVKGYLKRKGQPDVVWVNDKNTLDSNRPLPDVKVLGVRQPGKVKLHIQSQGIVSIKPGQILSSGQSKKIDSYEK